MSTKNLARSVIEGGRTDSYKSEVHEFTRAERAEERTFLKLVTRDPEAFDGAPMPQRRVVYTSFADKLGPVHSFLESRVGKNWNKTRSMLFARFDTRTTPGRHVLFDHLLRDVSQSGEHKLTSRSGFGMYFRYFVDDRGILRRNGGRHFRRIISSLKPEKPLDTKRIVAWLDGRKVGMMGARLVWFVSTRDVGVTVLWDAQYNRPVYAQLDKDGEVVMLPNPQAAYEWWSPKTVPCITSVPYRQARLLTSEDEAYFRSLPDYIQVKILEAAPRNTSEKGLVPPLQYGGARSNL